MQRFEAHIYSTKELIPFFKEPDTHINFLWFAEDSDTEEFIHEKESEYWAIYKKKGYHMINSHIPEYHKSTKGYKKKTKFKSKEEYLQDKEWITYKSITAKIPSDLQPLLIKFLREQLKLEYSEDYNLWTLPYMVDVIKNSNKRKRKMQKEWRTKTMAKKDIKSLYDKVQEKLKNVSQAENYKSLCFLLDEPDYSAKSQTERRTRQLEYWKMCFKWVKKGSRFTKIKVYSKQEYLENLMSRYFQDACVYNLCSFLAWYGDTYDDNSCVITKPDLSLAIGLSSLAFKDFHISNYQYGLALEQYVLDQRESKYPFVALPKKEIKENKEEKGKGALAKRTKDIMADYDIHVSANNNFKVDSTLGETNNKETLTAKEIKKKIDSFDGQGLTFTQKTFVGGFIERDKLPFNADYTQIYQENGRFYYPMKDEEPLLVQFKERCLTPKEISLFVDVRGSIINSMGFTKFNDVRYQGKQQEYLDKIYPELISAIGALFVYPVYYITFSRDLIKSNTSFYSNQIQELLDTAKIQKSLLKANKENQQKIISLKKERQKNNTLDTRNKFIKKDGSEQYWDKEDIETLDSNNQYEIFLYEKMNKDLLKIDINTFMPNISEESPNKSAIWQTLGDKSESKKKNYHEEFGDF